MMTQRQTHEQQTKANLAATVLRGIDADDLAEALRGMDDGPERQEALAVLRACREIESIDGRRREYEAVLAQLV